VLTVLLFSIISSAAAHYEKKLADTEQELQKVREQVAKYQAQAESRSISSQPDPNQAPSPREQDIDKSIEQYRADRIRVERLVASLNAYAAGLNAGMGDVLKRDLWIIMQKMAIEHGIERALTLAQGAEAKCETVTAIREQLMNVEHDINKSRDYENIFNDDLLTVSRATTGVVRTGKQLDSAVRALPQR